MTLQKDRFLTPSTERAECWVKPHPESQLPGSSEMELTRCIEGVTIKR